MFGFDQVAVMNGTHAVDRVLVVMMVMLVN